MAARQIDWANDLWRLLAHELPTRRRLWSNVCEVIGPGKLDPLMQELINVAISASNGCPYGIASHGAAARNKGMSETQYSELLAIVGLPNENNRLATALAVPVDARWW